MLEFIKFDRSNPDHKKLMLDGEDIIFEDHDGILRFGYMYEDYQGNGNTVYQFRSSGDFFEANGLCFTQIKIKDS